MSRYLFVLSLACAQPVGLTLTGPEPDTLVTIQSNECALQFAPTPDIESETQVTLERWSKATGCHLSIDPDGIPVESHPSLWVETFVDHSLVGDFAWEGSHKICGLSAWSEDQDNFYYIDVALDCDLSYTIAHEIGHVLSNTNGHSVSGVLAEAKNPLSADIIDESSLQFVCQNLTCSKFQPET